MRSLRKLVSTRLVLHEHVDSNERKSVDRNSSLLTEMGSPEVLWTMQAMLYNKF